VVVPERPLGRALVLSPLPGIERRHRATTHAAWAFLEPPRLGRPRACRSERSLLTSTFDYDLPDWCIARYPTEERDGARMLVVERTASTDDWVRNFGERVPEGSLLVVNDTRVRRARVLGRRRDSGRSVECLMLERMANWALGDGRELWTALGRPLRSLRPGVWIDSAGLQIRVVERVSEGQVVVEVEALDGHDVETALERHGRVPIPPYLGRLDEPSDVDRYQTIYADRQGSVAAPTAGLHLTERTLDALKQRGIEIGAVTLHVGVGTFRPVTVDDLDQHSMHSERVEVTAELAQRIEAVRRRNGKVIAVGTTAVRALESAADPQRPGFVNGMAGETRLLIQPGYRFRIVDGLLTNFHQPRSTLLALVAAAIGVDRVQSAYRAAIDRGYRFLSYGDAMWIPELIR
jgi:S-adenosylmethionine:tRNA ribosyltransferase-isomerase